MLPVHVGVVLHTPLAKQDTVADPNRVYPLLQLYVTVPPKIVLDGVPGDPLEIDGGGPQSTAYIHIQQKIKIINCACIVTLLMYLI